MCVAYPESLELKAKARGAARRKWWRRGAGVNHRPKTRKKKEATKHRGRAPAAFVATAALRRTAPLHPSPPAHNEAGAPLLAGHPALTRHSLVPHVPRAPCDRVSLPYFGDTPQPSGPARSVAAHSVD